MADKAIDRKHKLYDKYSSQWEMINDFCEGEEAVKGKGRAYLPELPSQVNQYSKNLMKSLYKVFLEKASLFPGAEQTLEAFKGILTRKQPSLDIPKKLDYIKTTFTLDGQDIFLSSSNACGEIIKKSAYAYLVDIPEEGDDPFAIPYTAESIYNWKYTVYKGGKKLTWVSLHTIEDEQEYIIYLKLTFDEESQQDIYTVERFKKVVEKNKINWVSEGVSIPLMRNKPLDFIPFVPMSKDGIIMNLTSPMLSRVTFLNKTHYQNDAEYRNSLAYAGRPTPCVSGLKTVKGEESVVLGTAQILQFEEGGSWGMLGLDNASGIDAIKQAGEDLKNDMALAGSKILRNDPRMAEAAETASIHREGEHGQLSMVANIVSKGITKVLQIMADWISEEITEPSFVMSTDFNPLKIDPALLNTIWAMYTNGNISEEVLWYNLKRGELTPDTWTMEDETKAKEVDKAKKPEPPPINENELLTEEPEEDK